MVGKYERGRLQAMEMWTWRKMTGINWIEHTTNEAVLVEVNQRTIINAIIKGKVL